MSASRQERWRKGGRTIDTRPVRERERLRRDRPRRERADVELRVKLDLNAEALELALEALAELGVEARPVKERGRGRDELRTCGSVSALLQKAQQQSKTDGDLFLWELRLDLTRVLDAGGSSADDEDGLCGADLALKPLVRLDNILDLNLPVNRPRRPGRDRKSVV